MARCRLTVSGLVATAIVLMAAIACRASEESASPWAGGAPTTQISSAGHAEDVRDTNQDPVPTGAVAECFPALTERAGDGPVRVDGWPAGLSSLLITTTAGDLWVTDSSGAVRWNPDGHSYLWSRWGEDGKVYASRYAGGAALAIDVLSRAGHIDRSILLPYSIRPEAPDGYCPINGYLATFTIGPHGMTLIKHAAGPLPISCPYGKEFNPSTTEDPWRCNLKEGNGFEIRSSPFEQAGTPGNDSFGPTDRQGNPSPMASDAEESSDLAIANGRSDPLRITILPMRSGAVCCSGGQAGSVFALSPDGNQVAYSPNGRTIQIEPTNPKAVGSPDAVAAETPWTSADLVDALRWTGDSLVVAHSGRLTQVPVKGGPGHDLSSSAIPPIRTIDTRR